MSATATQPACTPPGGELPEPAPAVRAAGLCVQIEDRQILHDIRFDVPAGRTVALLGANGAGKSTLLKVLSTLMPPSKGELHLFGEAIGPGSVAVRGRIGIVAHQAMLYRDLSVRENLTFFGRLYDLPDPAGRVEEILALVALADRADDAVKTLSRGMTQRAAIGRAMVHDPDLLLADEPFNGLDASSTQALETLIGRLGEAGKTLILANHNIAQSIELADRALVLRRGRVLIDAPVDGLTAESVLEEVRAG